MPRSERAILIVREEGKRLGDFLAQSLGADLLCPHADGKKPKDVFQAHFHEYRGWVMIMSAGIAVRFLDGLPDDKHKDPAVVVLDEGCHHAISLLSGHEGGANQLAFIVANAVGATPVVSTATESLKPLVVGIGCRKNVSQEQIEEAVKTALAERSLDDVRCVATVAAKEREPGLLQFCESRNLPIRVFSHEDVAVRAWVTEPSAWVKRTLGLDGVCEPCALMATPRGRLVVPKTTLNGVAVAVVEDTVRIQS